MPKTNMMLYVDHNSIKKKNLENTRHCWIPKLSYRDPENKIMPISPVSNYSYPRKIGSAGFCLLTTFLLKFILSWEDVQDLGRHTCATVGSTQRRWGAIILFFSA